MRQLYRIRPVLVVAAAAIAFGGCKKKSTEVEQEPEVATMRLTIGTGATAQTVNVNAATGVVTGGPISIKVNTATTIAATWLKADGSTDAIASTSEFQLNIAGLSPTSITFARTGDFTGTLTGTATTTSGTGMFSLFHKGEGHEEFEWAVTIHVVP